MATKFRQIRKLDDMLKSAAMEKVLMDLGNQVLAAAEADPNPIYVASLDIHTFVTADRIRVQVGAAPIIGMAVEAKRGTLAKALGSIGA